jgi:hypothetical protein
VQALPLAGPAEALPLEEAPEQAEQGELRVEVQAKPAREGLDPAAARNSRKAEDRWTDRPQPEDHQEAC